ncbi:unnamed protein product [Heterobilharzia americana]|nr:unnamed protein product [Heterobilharzia americana]
MKISSNYDLCLCIGLLSCIYMVNIKTSDAFIQIFDLPKFIMEPPNVIYYAPSQLSISQFIPKFHVYTIVSPRNVTIQLGAVHKDKSNMIIYLPTVHEYSTESYSLAFAQTHAKINSVPLTENLVHLNSMIPHISSNSNNVKQNINLWSIFVYNFLPDMKLIILASTKFGTVSSSLISVETFDLPAFPPQSDQYLSLLIGNTGRVICHLPHSRPSLPTAYFYHNDVVLDLTQTDRYSLIYVGGDDSGLPWDIRSQKPHFVYEQFRKTDKPGAVVLLIHSLQLSDAGIYYCSTKLFDKTIVSNQRTHLVVTKPNKKIWTHLRFSTDDSDLSHFYTVDSTSHSPMTSKDENSLLTVKTITINENANLTLFCIFESAPVVSTRWYFNGFIDNIEINRKFGTLIIKYVRQENEGIYTCSVDNSDSKLIGKSFRIVVTKSQIRSSLDPEVITAKSGRQVTLSCVNFVPKENDTSNHMIPDAKSPSPAEWEKWNYDTAIKKPNHDTDIQHENSKFRNSPHINSWIHNGQFISMSSSKNYHLQDGLLKILNTSHSDTGIYQYVSINRRTSSTDISSTENEFQYKLVNCKYFVQLDTENIVHTEINDQFRTIFEHTSEGLTGHLNCNLSSLLQTRDYHSANGLNQYQWSILWYRSATSTEPLNIESINKASGGIKYIISNVNEFTQILSIVNPKKITDDGQYICRVYNTTTGKLLGERRFQLIIQSINDEGKPTNIPSHGPSVSQKIFPPPLNVQSKHESSFGRQKNEISVKHESPNEVSQVKVSRPTVKRLANFTMAIHIKWAVHNSPISGMHYQLGLKHLGRDRKARSIAGYLYQHKISKKLSNQEEFAVLPNIYENTSIILDSPDLFYPQNSYSLRVLVLEHQLWSPWTEPVHFDNMLDTTVQIISLTANNASCLYVEWIYIQPRNNSIPLGITNSKDLNFVIIYRNLSGSPEDRKSLLELWTESRVNDEKQFPIVQITGDTSLTGHSIDRLSPNTTYAVSVYIEEKRFYQHQSKTYYTRLSNEAVQKTLPLTIGRNLTAENFTQEEASKAEDMSSQTSSDLRSKMSRQYGGKNDPSGKLFKIYQHESYVLIVILGSLAGVLLIIFIALITFCIWYRLRLKSQYPTSYFGALSDSELTGTPKQRTATEWENFQSQPVLTGDNHQTFPRAAGNFHLQSLDGQQKQSAELNNFATLQHSAHWLQQPKIPYEGQYRKSMLLDSAMKSYWMTHNYNEARVAFMRTQNLENVANNSALPPLSKDLFLQNVNINKNNECTTGNGATDHIGSLEGIFQEASVNEQFNHMAKMLNTEVQPINDQSSSIYSHIGSDSTVNDLSQFQLDRFNSVLPTTTLCDYFGFGTNILSMQNDNGNSTSRRDTLRDYSQTNSLSVTANPLYPFITKPDDLVSLPLTNHHEPVWCPVQSGMISNGTSSFYTTVPPSRHLQHPSNGDVLINPSDQTFPSHINIPASQNIVGQGFQQYPFIQNLIPVDRQQILCGSNPLTCLSTPFSSYADSLTAALTLQQWVEHMSKPTKINDNVIRLYKEVYRKSDIKTKLNQDEIVMTKNDQQNLCNETNRHHKSPRENLSSSFADSGVDLPSTNNLESDILEHTSNRNESPQEMNRRRTNIVRPVENISSGP